MNIGTENTNSGGKAVEGNPLAFLGLRRVDGEDEDENDNKSIDINVDGEGKLPNTLGIFFLNITII